MVLGAENMQTDDLIRLIALAKNKSVRFKLQGMAGLQTQEPVRIAVASGGSVISVLEADEFHRPYQPLQADAAFVLDTHAAPPIQMPVRIAPAISICG